VPAAMPAERSDPSLLVGHVESLLYRGERLTLSVGIENPPAASRGLVLKVRVHQENKAQWQTDVPAVVDAAETSYLDVSCKLPDARKASATCSLSLFEGQRQLDGADIAIVAPDARMPRLQSEGSNLRGPDGRYVAIQIEQRLWRQDRSWTVLKAIRDAVTHAKQPPRSVMLISDVLPGADAPGGYWRMLLDKLKPQGVRLIGPARRSGSIDAPAMATLAQFSRADLAAPIKAAVFFVGTADQQRGTEPRLLHLALEAMVQRLQAAGCERFTFVLPIAPPPLREEMKPYVATVLHVAHIYKARTVDLPRRLSRGLWLSSRGKGAPVYRQVPDHAGHRKVFKTLLGAVARDAELK